MRHAVIGIGSNSTRMLIADIQSGQVTDIQRQREGTRLFAGLEGGNLSADSMARTADAVMRLAQHARDANAEKLHILATSATRDAQNGEAFAALIEEISGVPLAIISGEEEARLSFLGAAAGHGYCGMVDIGGGSTEIAIGGDKRPFGAASAQLGAVRLLGEVPILLGDGYEKALAIARARAEAAWGSLGRKSSPPPQWFGAGGTINAIAALDMRLPAYDRDAVDGHVLSIGAVENWARRLHNMPMAQRAALPGMLPQREDIIAHGAIILLGVMQATGMACITASNRNNLNGYLADIAAQADAPDPVVVVRGYYDATVEMEWERLEKSWFEFTINKHFIDKYVKPGDRVLDVGGGPGRYSLHLAQRGADVTLVDLSDGNVAFARQKAAELGLTIEAMQGDARAIDQTVEGPFDAVLLMGPLYHLLDEADRAQTVEACLRLLKPGGVLFVAFIATVAGMIYAARELPESILWEGEDMFYEKIIRQQDFAGQAFTQAFFIDPAGVEPFMARFAMDKLHLVGSESITAPFHHQLMGAEDMVRDKWLKLALDLCERQPFISYSEHLLYIGKKVRISDEIL